MGSLIGVVKVAAQRSGCSTEEWQRRHAEGQRRCFACQTWKPVDRFAIDKTRGSRRQARCKACANEASTASRYGMTVAQLAAFRLANGGRCAICKRTGRLCVDHNHTNGKPRGMLCQNCNSAIGKLKEDPALFAAALAYLEAHRG